MKDLDKTGIVAIDFGTKSTTAIYMNKNGRYCLLSIGKDVDTDCLEKYENPTIVEFRNKEKFLKAYNALSHRPFTEHNDMEVWRMKPRRVFQTLKVIICIGFFLN
ncbi:hypothetical protein HpSP24_05990 [Helicobacter pylori]